VTFDPMPVPKNEERPEVAQARADPEVQAFLVWSRFPFWLVEPDGTSMRVTVGDMRFATRNAGRFSVTTTVED
jgi:hypothetical protein